MGKVKNFFDKKRQDKARNDEVGAKKAVLEEVFNDMYSERRKIYKVNFVRGITFGAGSAVGGTIVLGLAVWIFSLFVHVPVVGNTFKDAQNSIERSTH